MSRLCAIHWFTYYGWVGSSSPVCVRCGAPNPRYDADLQRLIALDY
jgi:hypothetical protein